MCLVDAATYHTVPLQRSDFAATQLCTISTSNNEYISLFANIPEITMPNFVVTH